jgi:hypothetical protein
MELISLIVRDLLLELGNHYTGLTGHQCSKLQIQKRWRNVSTRGRLLHKEFKILHRRHHIIIRLLISTLAPVIVAIVSVVSIAIAHRRFLLLMVAGCCRVAVVASQIAIRIATVQVACRARVGHGRGLRGTGSANRAAVLTHLNAHVLTVQAEVVEQLYSVVTRLEVLVGDEAYERAVAVGFAH